MKLSKILLSSILLMILSSSVMASVSLPNLQNVFVGADLGHSIHGLNHHAPVGAAGVPQALPKSKSGIINVYAGHRFTDRLGLEGGVFSTIRTSKNRRNKPKARVSHYGAHLDGVVYTPVYGNLEVFGGLGLQLAKSKVSKKDHYVGKRNSVSPRLMAGLQYPITTKSNVRAGLAYTRSRAAFKNVNRVSANDSVNYSIGVNYLF